MADSADAEKAEKLAAAKKRFEELKKEKQKGAKVDKEKGKKGDIKKKKTAANESKEGGAKKATEKTDKQEKTTDPKPEDENEEPEANPDHADGEGVANGPKSDGHNHDAALDEGQDAQGSDDEQPEHAENQDTLPDAHNAPSAQRHTRQPSLSLQSRMRSDSFRKGTQASPRSPSISTKGQPLPALNPDGDSMNEIYRKQTQRLEELEKENRQLAKDAEAAQGRQQKMETELDGLRENASQLAELKARAERASAKDEEISKLKIENASLQRQNSHLQTSAQKSSRKDTTSPSSAHPSSPGPSDLLAQLDSKTTTIESMELEISNLRAQLAKSMSSGSSHTEQVAALEEKAARAERAANNAQRELQDTRKKLERASEKSVRDGTERTSAETKIRTLERERDESRAAHEEANRKCEQLGSKLSALTTLHKDTDARRQSGAKELADARRQLDKVTTDVARLRDERSKQQKRDGTGATDDDALDELEDEARAALQARVRDLEAEVFELRRGVWQDRRREMQSTGAADDVAVFSPRGSTGGGFDEVDLIGGGSAAAERRPSQREQRRTSSFRTVLTSGIKAFTGEADGGAGDGLLEDDDDLAFDETAFRQAQEEDAYRRLERVRELKRGLSAHSSFRVDLVDLRRSGGGGLGEIFEV